MIDLEKRACKSYEVIARKFNREGIKSILMWLMSARSIVKKAERDNIWLLQIS